MDSSFACEQQLNWRTMLLKTNKKYCLGTFQVFSGNTDSSSVVFNKLNATTPIQYVRFYPISYNRQPCMQASVFGCSAGE